MAQYGSSSLAQHGEKLTEGGFFLPLVFGHGELPMALSWEPSWEELLFDMAINMQKQWFNFDEAC